MGLESTRINKLITSVVRFITIYTQNTSARVTEY